MEELFRLLVKSGDRATGLGTSIGLRGSSESAGLPDNGVRDGSDGREPPEAAAVEHQGRCVGRPQAVDPQQGDQVIAGEDFLVQ
jgi:hypothetical protein